MEEFKKNYRSITKQKFEEIQEKLVMELYK